MTDELKLAKDVVDGELELLCTEMQLLSCPGYHASMFDGTGLIRAGRGGRLSFEIVGRYDSGFPPLVRTPSLPHGQVPEPDNHVMLRAVDCYGREWRSNWVMPRASPPGSRSNCWAVSCALETLMHSENRASSDSSEGRLYIELPGAIPFDQATHISKRVGEEQVETGWSRDCHARTIGSAEVEFREHERRWLIVRARQKDPVMPDWAGVMCQALSLATARTVRPVVAVREFNARTDIGIFSGPFSHPRSFLPRPVPPTDEQNFWVLIQKFFEWARSVDVAAASGVFEELSGIRNGSTGSIRTAALTLATALESLAEALLPCSEANTESAGSVELLLGHVRKWEGDPTIRQRAESMLGSLKRVRPVDRLHGFANNRSIAAELVNAWKRLRDMAAHGRAPDASQVLYDRYFSTAELLYRILAFAIGYEGSICATATRGWKLDEWGFPAATVTDER